MCVIVVSGWQVNVISLTCTAMDLQLSELIGTQYAFHALVVGGVLLFALLVYVFGFKSAVEPPFDKLTNPHEDRKANGKKKKPKEKVMNT